MRRFQQSVEKRRDCCVYCGAPLRFNASRSPYEHHSGTRIACARHRDLVSLDAMYGGIAKR